MATINELWTIETMPNDDRAHHMARTGVSLTYHYYASLGADQIAWLRGPLGLVMTQDDRGVHFTPPTVVHPSAVCFIADAPGTYGASDGRVWSSHRSIEDGRRAVRQSRGARVVLHHGSLEPGTHWTSHMESIYPEVK